MQDGPQNRDVSSTKGQLRLGILLSKSAKAFPWEEIHGNLSWKIQSKLY
jgi:hypothetical protein